MDDFCRRYASYIQFLSEQSHNFKSSQIEANYDDYQERQVRPINATIFYYFFGLSRQNKWVLQWLLSAANYPNERVRKAYMRFFF